MTNNTIIPCVNPPLHLTQKLVINGPELKLTHTFEDLVNIPFKTCLYCGIVKEVNQFETKVGYNNKSYYTPHKCMECYKNKIKRKIIRTALEKATDDYKNEWM